MDEMNSVANTLKQLVGFLTQERRNKDDAIKSILLPNHPAFSRMAVLTKTPYRVFFSTREEMKARSWEPVLGDRIDSDSVEEWWKDGKYLKFKKKLFDGKGGLVSYRADNWNDDWIELVNAFDEDDIPF